MGGGDGDDDDEGETKVEESKRQLEKVATMTMAHIMGPGNWTHNVCMIKHNNGKPQRIHHTDTTAYVRMELMKVEDSNDASAQKVGNGRVLVFSLSLGCARHSDTSASRSSCLPTSENGQFHYCPGF